VRKRNLTPDHDVELPRVKRRPRGKPFPKGHSFGLAHRFKPGESGNPHGRPKSAEISKALRTKLAAEISLPRIGRTYAEQLVDKWVALGLKGNAAAIAAIADRAEGRAAISITTDTNDNSLNLIVASWNERSAELGPPEGFIELNDGGEPGESADEQS
jgi:hypothetical protein